MIRSRDARHTENQPPFCYFGNKETHTQAHICTRIHTHSPVQALSPGPYVIYAAALALCAPTLWLCIDATLKGFLEESGSSYPWPSSSDLCLSAHWLGLASPSLTPCFLQLGLGSLACPPNFPGVLAWWRQGVRSSPQSLETPPDLSSSSSFTPHAKIWWQAE